MLRSNQPADPRIHEAAQRLARRFVSIIGAVLRDEEKGLAMREAYAVAREEIEAFAKGKEG